MAARSTISRDPAVQEAVEKAFVAGKTIDEIVAMLSIDGATINGKPVTRSTVGRYAKRYRPLVEEVIRARHAMEALRSHLPVGDLALSELAQHKLNVQILRTLDEREAAEEAMDGKELAALARTLHAGLKSEGAKLDVREKYDEIDRKKAAKVATSAARRAGASPEQLRAIRDGLLGMKS